MGVKYIEGFSMIATCSLGGVVTGPEIMGNHALKIGNGFGVLGLLCAYLYDCSDKSTLQTSEHMQEVVGVTAIMGRPSYKWEESSTEELPGEYTYPLTTKPLRGAR